MSTSFSSALFITFTTASAHSISVTPVHLVGVSRDNRATIFLSAKELKCGDSLHVVSEGRVLFSPVIQVIEEMKQGTYAPLIVGTLLVNGVLASSYANVHSHNAAHFIMAPLRFYCALRQELLSAEDPFGGQEQDGIHAVSQVMFDVAKFLAPSKLLLA